MKAPRKDSRHGLNAPMARVKLRGFTAIDRRMAGARATLAFRCELAAALGGDSELSPQRRRLVDLTARSALLLDHVDAWLFSQRSLVNARTRTLVPVLVQRQALADHLTRLLDKLGLDRVPRKLTLHEVVLEIEREKAAGTTEHPTSSESALHPSDGGSGMEAGQ